MHARRLVRLEDTDGPAWETFWRDFAGVSNSFDLLLFFVEVFCVVLVDAGTRLSCRDFFVGTTGASGDVAMGSSGSRWPCATVAGAFCLLLRFRFFSMFVVSVTGAWSFLLSSVTETDSLPIWSVTVVHRMQSSVESSLYAQGRSHDRISSWTYLS